tara:strand:- start:431 stop:640 length:210 start_codon:yes stop_codon:yes gene_type:complete
VLEASAYFEKGAVEAFGVADPEERWVAAFVAVDTARTFGTGPEQKDLAVALALVVFVVEATAYLQTHHN